MRPLCVSGHLCQRAAVGGGERHDGVSVRSPTTAARVTVPPSTQAPKVPAACPRVSGPPLSRRIASSAGSRLAGKWPPMVVSCWSSRRTRKPRGRRWSPRRRRRQLSASSTTSPRVSRARRLRRGRAGGESHRRVRLEDVADAADGVDQRAAPGVDLLAQIADVELDDVRLAAEVVGPHAVEDLGLATARGAGCACRKRSSSNSVGRQVHDLAAAGSTSRASSSITRSPTVSSFAVSVARVMPARRSSPRSRASTSSRLKGLVT